MFFIVCLYGLNISRNSLKGILSEYVTTVDNYRLGTTPSLPNQHYNLSISEIAEIIDHNIVTLSDHLKQFSYKTEEKKLLSHSYLPNTLKFTIKWSSSDGVNIGKVTTILFGLIKEPNANDISHFLNRLISTNQK